MIDTTIDTRARAATVHELLVDVDSWRLWGQRRRMARLAELAELVERTTPR